MSLDREMQRLRARCEELEEENRQLRDELRGERFDFDPALRLTALETEVLRLLAARSPNVVARRTIYDHIWLDRRGGGDCKSPDVYLSMIRKKLAAMGATIETHWGRGVSLPKSSLEAVLRRP